MFKMCRVTTNDALLYLAMIEVEMHAGERSPSIFLNFTIGEHNSQLFNVSQSTVNSIYNITTLLYVVFVVGLKIYLI